MSKIRPETKDFRLEIKTLDDESGTFTGILSAYNVVDLGNDMVEPGAFTKNMEEAGSLRPLLWQHKTDEPIGQLDLKDSAEGLLVTGTLDLNLQRAREAYSLIKKGIIKGLSIGYRAIRKKMEGGIRHLKEIELFEGSIVTFPMLPLAQVTTVKTTDQSKDFLQELADAQTMAMYYLMMQALDYSLCEVRWDAASGPEDKIAASGECIDQFKTAYLAYLPMYFDVMEGDGMGMMSAQQRADMKAGRRISSASRTKIEEAISNLQALLAEETDSTAEPETAAADTPKPSAATPPATGVNDVDLKAMMSRLIQKLKEN